MKARKAKGRRFIIETKYFLIMLLVAGLFIYYGILMQQTLSHANTHANTSVSSNRVGIFLMVAVVEFLIILMFPAIG